MLNLSRANLAAWLLALATLLGSVGHAEVAVPTLQARVTDLTATLSADQKSALEQTLAAFEQKKGSQIGVLIVPTTQPESIEQYSIRVVAQWRLGRKGVDDGALLIIAKDDHAMRIEVGYGLEGALTDVVCARIIREIITPKFRSGDFNGGIQDGIARMIGVVDGEPLPPPAAAAPGDNGGLNSPYLIFVLAAAVVGGGIARAMFGRLPGALVSGGAAGVVLYLLIGALAIAIPAGFFVFLFILLGGGGGRWAGGGSGTFGGGFGGGYSGGSGGGFGGGGGGFGGGGASGSW